MYEWTHAQDDCDDFADVRDFSTLIQSKALPESECSAGEGEKGLTGEENAHDDRFLFPLDVRCQQVLIVQCHDLLLRAKGKDSFHGAQCILSYGRCTGIEPRLSSMACEFTTPSQSSECQS